jgi:hypothetical protein
MFRASRGLLAVAIVALPVAAGAEESDAELAQELTNPVADLVTVPIQMNLDRNIGPAEDGTKLTTNIQPVIPFDIGENWNLITRTIIPVVHQDDLFPGAGSQFGLGDINLSLFLSPKRPTAGGLTWGAGPVFLLPTATDELLGADKWGAGPTGVALKQVGPWTYGALANHIWSFAGDGDRNDISNTFLQPFVTYTTPTAWSFALQAEATYDWKAEQWNVPVGFLVSKVVRLGKQMISLQAGPRYYVESTPGGPEGWSFRAAITLLFPK